MATNRDWMYRMDTFEFYEGIDEFAKQAHLFAKSRGLTDGKIQCPCRKCKNRKRKGSEDVKYDLYRYGFIPNYYTWIVHGEIRSVRPDPPVHERVVCRLMRLYTGGSISIPQHKWLLRDELKREPTAIELFARTYMRKNDRCVDNAAKETYDQYHENYDANDSLDAESGNVNKKYRRGVDYVMSKKEIEVDYVCSKNDVEVDHVGSMNDIKVDHVGSKNEIEVNHVGSMNELEVDVGSKNEIEVYHVGSKDKVSVDPVDSKNEISVDHVDSKNEKEVDENVFQCINIDTPSIHTSNNEEHVQIREMMERQQVEQKLLREENEYLRATQLTQMQKLDQVMQSQKSFEENVRCIVAQEMEKATQKLLDALQNLPRGL